MIKNKESLIKGRFSSERKDLLEALESAFSRVDSYLCVRRFLERKENILKIGGKRFNLKEVDNIYLLSFGKAAVRMAKAVLDTVEVAEGIVVSNGDFTGFPGNIKYFAGGHPIPNENSVSAGEAVLNLARKTKDSDLTIVLISGGGSALLEKPLVPLKDLQEVTRLLMKSGADIFELNTVRKHLSEIKGGKLLLHLKGSVVSLIISDVIGDSLDTIASGPTYFDNSTFSEALSVLKKYNLLGKAPKSVIEVFKKGEKGEIPETLKEDSFIEKRCDNILVATNFDACRAAAAKLSEKGYSVFYLGSAIQGESREIAKAVCGIAGEIRRGRIDIKPPVAILFGGETTVTVKGNGIGGRNEEFVLATLPFVSRLNGVVCSIGTDGIDGMSDAAGAIADSDTKKLAESAGLDWREYLKNNDSHTFFNRIGSLVYTGKTETNVADIVIFISSNEY